MNKLLSSVVNKIRYIAVFVIISAMTSPSYAQTVTPGSQDDGLIIYGYQLDQLAGQVSNRDEWIHAIRQSLVSALVSQGYTKRISYPYGRDARAGYKVTADRTGASYQSTSIADRDDLDRMIATQTRDVEDRPRGSDNLREYSPMPDIVLSAAQLRQIKPIYLWKYPGDLEALGYQLVSHRMRISHDKPYRLHNIKTALMMIGHVRVVMPGETIKFFSSIGFDSAVGKKYKAGYGILGNREALIYGGGICGASTALYQGILANQGFTIVKAKNHSKRYNAYYNATINGIDFNVPGLDAMVFGGQQDFVFRNDRSYPLIIVSNFDGKAGSAEEVFSLGMEQDRGSIELVGTFALPKQSCATWTVNGRIVERCYGKVVM